ncbi:N-acyl-D-amino-acid deacylase family protein [Pseudonocardia sp. CA-107938]|uniref:N-acyl-D-amino-acid deacylase family protein n=1 Tax=Pseudonocardia sp. CA-107938 TaxID=3240021 RepID=UPI003D8E3953
MADFDLIIRGGSVVDGTGGPEFTGDVAVTGGRIAAVGRVDGAGRREVDADGATVTPGFVDIHTHYDGQATWDSTLQPSSWHGVTTVLAGNCGVGFAPARATDHHRLIKLMEGIEDIPEVALTEGLRWDWESFPEFMDVLARRPRDIDMAVQIPHAPLRVYVMGDRAAARADATDDEIAQMARLVREAISAGALGFSTSRTLKHKAKDGENTPSYGVGDAELSAIARALGETGTGVLQLVADFVDLDDDFRVIEGMARSSRRPVSVSLAQERDRPDTYRAVLARITALNAQGHQVKAQVAARGIGMLLGLQCSLHPFMTNPVWKAELAGRPVAEQARLMAEPTMKAKVLAAHTGHADPTVLGGDRIYRWEAMFPLTDPPDYEPPLDRSVAAIASRTGRSAVEVAYDLVVQDGGRAMIYEPFTNYADGSLDPVREMLVHPHSLPGLSDGGAHIGVICDASFPTSQLQYWARERPSGRLPLTYVVQRQARDTARFVGLGDRGVIAPGYKADLNVIDLPHLRLRLPEVHFDLPAGGRRLLQRADGYVHTFVSGVETYSHGAATGERPGRLVRGGTS